jgi:histidine ammonia-lyase/phenylalanine ammonia-lyase
MYWKIKMLKPTAENKVLKINSDHLSFDDFRDFVFDRENFKNISVDEKVHTRMDESYRHLLGKLDSGIPLYGVTTGFGDSATRLLSPTHVNQLQKNLVNYLTCGSGPLLSVEACRATLLARFQSLSRGYSGIRRELLDGLQLLLEKDWIPVIPAEGSLGASGDLVPLAYIGQCVQGRGLVYVGGEKVEISTLLEKENIPPLTLQAKEGLALVNGTSAMMGLATVNWQRANHLKELAAIASAWTCLALQGRNEAFGELVNARAGQHPGQALMAEKISQLLRDENYQATALEKIPVQGSQLSRPPQDRYSLRCSPQILGPIQETLQLTKKWFEDELNSTSDNPLISPEGDLANGGNFYGGYLAHGMDYIKIGLAQMADMCDRQLILIMDEKSNRGLPPNLANWPGMDDEEKFLHHGLKGLHQSASALTSEICALATPNGIFSRSAECHNQDKVSLGMSAAVQCDQMIQKTYTLLTLQLICLAQGLDLKKIRLRGTTSSRLYKQIRSHVPFVAHDQALHQPIENLREQLKKSCHEREL